MTWSGKMSGLKTLLEKSRIGFSDRFDGNPDLLAYAPGRINVIGGHTDYNGGLALPSAIDRWISVALRPRRDGAVNVFSLDFSDEVSFTINRGFEPKANWHHYILGASELFNKKFRPTHGFDALITGNVPPGSGVSSSAALETAFLNGLRALYNVRMDDETLIRLCRRIENEYLGLPSGLLDQYASQFSRKGKLLLIDFRIPSHRFVPDRLSGWAWVVTDSGITRKLAGSAYRDRVRECAEGLERIKTVHPEVNHFRDITLEHIAGLAAAGGTVPARRLRHYVEENLRVLKMARTVSSGDPEKAGRLMQESHESLSGLYEVSSPELDFLIETSRNQEGCTGGRMIGGGFGGCTLCLVRQNLLEGFARRVRRAYQSKFNRRAIVYRFNLTGGAGTVPHTRQP